jgi:hypothetical protein
LANATLLANETVVAEPVLDVLLFAKPVPPILEAAVQSETVSDVLLLPDSLDLVQTEQVQPLDLIVQTDPDPCVEEVQQVKQVLGRVVGKPTGCGKKTKSINKLCAAEVDKDKKSRGKKEKKLSGKKRRA